MSKILRRRTADGRARRLLHPTPNIMIIERRRTTDGRVRRIFRSPDRSPVNLSITTPAAVESLARQNGAAGVQIEWLALEQQDAAILVDWLEQTNEVVADDALSIEWSALPTPVRVSLERLLASPGKRRLLATPGRLRLQKRP
jgi:hypothetical protein